MQEMQVAIEEGSSTCWLLEHEPVYTNGTSIASSGVVQTNRGGGNIYHGPGQCVVYFAARLKDLSFEHPHELIEFLEDCICQVALQHSIEALKRLDGPGVWIPSSTGLLKVAFIGLRMNKDMWVSHGMAVNLQCDLSKFENIDVCGKQCKVGNLGLSMKDFTLSLISIFEKQFSLQIG